MRNNIKKFSGICGIIGVIMLVVSFNINPGPPEGASYEQLIAFGHQYYASILWGAWLQTIGPFLIILFAFSLVFLSGAGQTLSGWMVFFGSGVLMTISLIEITFYIAVLFKDPPQGSLFGLNIIYAVQHLYFIIGAPAVFIPLGIVLRNSNVLPRLFSWLAIGMGIFFGILGIVFLFHLILPVWVTAIAGVQAFWWLASSIIVVVRSK
ncbi:MAG TPA: hypothetical protein VNW49_11850 [Puia sp.]|nr:hypothetical protein [Puia sp.]